MSRRVMAIISGVGFGMRDCDAPVLWFSVSMDESSGALQVLGLNEAVKLIEAYRAHDVRDLNGKPIWVKVDGNSVTIDGPCVLRGGR